MSYVKMSPSLQRTNLSHSVWEMANLKVKTSHVRDIAPLPVHTNLGKINGLWILAANKKTSNSLCLWVLTTKTTFPLESLSPYILQALCMCVIPGWPIFPSSLSSLPPPSTWKTEECKEIWAWQDGGAGGWTEGWRDEEKSGVQGREMAKRCRG